MTQAGDVVLLRSDEGRRGSQPVVLLRQVSREKGDWLACAVECRQRPPMSGLWEPLRIASTPEAAATPGTPCFVRPSLVAVVREGSVAGRIGILEADQLMRIRIRLAGWLKE